MSFLLHDTLEQAGFILQTELPSGTRYADGNLYMRLAATGTVRVFLPAGTDTVEISSGSIFAPNVHYTGPVRSVDELLRFIHGYDL